MCSSATARSTARVASSMLTSGARLKLIVTAGNWPWWLITSGCSARSILVTAESGTCAPLAPGT